MAGEKYKFIRTSRNVGHWHGYRKYPGLHLYLQCGLQTLTLQTLDQSLSISSADAGNGNGGKKQRGILGGSTPYTAGGVFVNAGFSAFPNLNQA